MTQEERIKLYEASKAKKQSNLAKENMRMAALSPEARHKEMDILIWGWRKDRAPIGLFPGVPTTNKRHWDPTPPPPVDFTLP